jgi:uncharacterized protein YjbJ (UPF0337 family)
MLIRRIKLAVVSLVLLTGAAVLAQGVVVEDGYPVARTAEAVVGPSPWYFFLAIVVGVILAISFELILTHLSVAAGISSVGPFDRYAKRETKPAKVEAEGEGAVMRTVRKTSNMFGVWALVTATVSLFFASWLAVELSQSPSAFTGFVLGLSIWALFYIIMTAIEVTALTSLVGSLTHTAAEGLRSAYKATTSIFGKSEEDRIVDTAERVTAAVRDELFGDVDTDRIRKQVDKYVRQLRPATAEEIKDTLRDMLDDTELRALVEHGEGELADVDVMTATLETKGVSREKARTMATNVRSAISKIREEYKSDKDRFSKISDAAMRVAGRSEEEARSAREQIEDYLRRTHKDELEPEGIKRDLEKLFSHPREGLSAVRERLSHFDRTTLEAILAQRQDMSEDEARKVTDRVMSVIDRIRGKTEEAAGEVTGEVEARRRGIQAKISNYLNSMGRPELRYEGIKHDIQTLFHDPRAGADALIRRLRAMDRDTLKAIIASRRDVSDEDAEHIVSQMERARDETIARYERMKEEVQHRIEDAKDRALREAEETRKAARNAAWWTFGSAIASACAAIVGGILSTYT